VPKNCCETVERSLPKAAAWSDETEEELARYAKALGHPLRVRILRILAQQTECICGDMVALLPVAQSTVSQHLKVLKEAGLVQGEIDGPRVRYCIEPGALKRLKTMIQWL
jgi:ArsR family transcriptional regulator